MMYTKEILKEPLGSSQSRGFLIKKQTCIYRRLGDEKPSSYRDMQDITLNPLPYKFLSRN